MSVGYHFFKHTQTSSCPTNVCGFLLYRSIYHTHTLITERSPSLFWRAFPQYDKMLEISSKTGWEKSYFYLCPCQLNACAICLRLCVYGKFLNALMLSLCGVFLLPYICFATDAFVTEDTNTFECNSMRGSFTHLNVFFVVSTVCKHTYAHIACCMGCILTLIYRVFHLCKLFKRTGSSELCR